MMDVWRQVTGSSDLIASKFEKISADLLQVLTETGYIAASCGLSKHVDAIFTGITAVRPKNEMPWIAFAIAKISLGKLSEAFEILTKRALALNPKSDLAKAFLGLIFSRVGSNQLSEHFLGQVIEENQTPEAIELAKKILQRQDEGWNYQQKFLADKG